jgi:hypothetical protein
MNAEETRLLQQIRKVPDGKCLQEAHAAMSAAGKRQFDRQNATRQSAESASTAAHDAMRRMLAKSEIPVGRGPVRALRHRKATIGKLVVPSAPKAPRLKLGSIHLVDTAPFQALTWQDVEVYGGTVENNTPQPQADGSTGNMGFNIEGGGWEFDNNSSVSCWCAIGQTYFVPDAANLPDFGGAFLRFSASPSFNWEAVWGSDLWRLASGDIWIGQVVNQFDLDGTLIATPVSYQQSLVSWNDYNFADTNVQAGNNTAFGLSTWVFVQPQFFYNAWVWIGASAYADSVDSGFSVSNAIMNANVSNLIFDTF